MPTFVETPKTERWTIIITKEATEAKTEFSTKNWIQPVQKIIETNPATTQFWFETLIKGLFRYFYPFIASEAILHVPQAGYFPYCPPILHVLYQFIN